MIGASTDESFGAAELTPHTQTFFGFPRRPDPSDLCNIGRRRSWISSEAKNMDKPAQIVSE